ncbi:MAG: DPP IV N-terminal domain-containing protein, partial [Bacteroidales bacterium]|nr:DPP IV N-terminal domain-containing protein [Bacteroidales bacterium]
MTFIDDNPMHQKLIIVCFYITLICSPCSLKAQVTSEDYNRADSVAKFNDLVYHSMYSPTWIDSTHHLWYKIKTKQGVEYIMINADNQKKTVAFDQEKLCKQVNHATGKEYKPYSIPVSHISFSKDLKTLYFILDSFNWKCSLNHYKLDKLQKVEKEKQQKYWGESVNELGNPPVVSPDSQWTASIREYNVVITDRKTNQSYQLSYDGSEGEFYSSYIAWSPDSKRIATYKVRDNKKRCIYFIE